MPVPIPRTPNREPATLSQCKRQFDFDEHGNRRAHAGAGAEAPAAHGLDGLLIEAETWGSRERTTFTWPTPPSGITTASTITTPWIFWRIASAV